MKTRKSFRKIVLVLLVLTIALGSFACKEDSLEDTGPKELSLLDFDQEFDSPEEEAVYEIYRDRNPNFDVKSEEKTFPVLAVDIVDIIEEDDFIKVFSVIRRDQVQLYDNKKLETKSAYIIPNLAVFKLEDESYKLIDHIEAEDGEKYSSSIEKMTESYPDVRDKLLNYDNERLNSLIKLHLKDILSNNGYENIDLEDFY